MECQPSDSKKLLKVFDASKRKRIRKKREGIDDSNSLATDDSTNGSKANGRRVCSAKASLQNTTPGPADFTSNTNRDSSPATSPVDIHRPQRSPRRHRASMRDGISLALKAGLVSTPRSTTPSRQGEAGLESVPQDHDSFIYQFLEEAIKRDKKKQRHSRRHELRKPSCDRAPSPTREHRHHRRRHREESIPAKEGREELISRSKEKQIPAAPVIDQNVLLETFAKICAEINNKPSRYKDTSVCRTISHKSLQCEVLPRRDSYEASRSPVKEHNVRDQSPPSRIRSHENFRSPARRDNCTTPEHRISTDKCTCCAANRRYSNESKMAIAKSRSHVVQDIYNPYPHDVTPTGSCVDRYANHRPEQREYKDYGDRREPVRDRYTEDRRRYCEQKASRSFEIQRDYPEDIRGTSRSDPHRSKRPEMQRSRRYCDRHRERYFEEKPEKDRMYNFAHKEKSRRQLEQSDKSSVDERLSERERDSGMSETSTMSGRSNYMKIVKQEIAEQREAMDKMMKLWKELMRCFKGMSQGQNQNQEKTVQDAENVRDSATEQLRLWRECMRRYETVARDVGDTDARLMEEITKQRSEMAEMAHMWQECLQRYRDMSNDFNSLKKQLATPEPVPRPQPPPPPPPLCAEGESVPTPPQYRVPQYTLGACPMAAESGVPVAVRGRSSAPPAWWWAEGPPRRRSSPESRASRERRHRRKERDEPRYKEKSSKANAARSEHRHRKR